MRRLNQSSYALDLRGAAFVMVAGILAGALVLIDGADTEPPPAEAFTVSYGDAVDALEGVQPAEATEQVRDWVRLGLAGELELDLPELRAALYDRPVFRDDVLSDVLRHERGPVRSLFDGSATLHLMVDAAVEHRDRALGLALDQFRADAGEDPERVVVWSYTLDRQARSAQLTPVDAGSTAAVRDRLGYVIAELESLNDVQSFLESTHVLSRLEAGSRLVAHGWDWGGAPRGPVTAADLAVLHDSYLSGDPPGFSLDPAQRVAGPLSLTAADEKVLLPDVDPTVRDWLFALYRQGPWRVAVESINPDMLAANSFFEVAEMLQDMRDPATMLLLGLYEVESQLFIGTLAGRGTAGSQRCEVRNLLRRLDADVAALSDRIEAEFDIAPCETSDVGSPSPDRIRASFDAVYGTALAALVLRGLVASEVDAALFDRSAGRIVPLPDDPVRLWAAAELVEGRLPVSVSRYDGVLAGTEVGMTLFYTDWVGKRWTTGVGASPEGAIPGFVTDPTVDLPVSHCAEVGEESGRLWFGQHPGAFAFGDRDVRIGTQATRLFAASEDPDAAGEEIEPTYAFGLPLRWWDRNYLAVADYEPEYHRLDNLMRWSGALEWLVARRGETLPMLGGETGAQGLRFADWYPDQERLVERGEAHLVELSGLSGAQEAILTRPSEPFDRCGRSIVGGVSLSDLLSRAGRRGFNLEAPRPLRRAGLHKPAANAVEDLARGGQIVRAADIDGGDLTKLTRFNLGRVEGGVAPLRIASHPRLFTNTGRTRILLPGDGSRQITMPFRALDDGFEIQSSLGARAYGTVRVTRTVDGIRLNTDIGELVAARRVLSKLEDGAGPATLRALARDGDIELAVIDQAVDGAHHLRVATDQGSRWLRMTPEGPAAEAGDGIAFRVGVPNGPFGGTTSHRLRFAASAPQRLLDAVDNPTAILALPTTRRSFHNVFGRLPRDAELAELRRVAAEVADDSRVVLAESIDEVNRHINGTGGNHVTIIGHSGTDRVIRLPNGDELPPGFAEAAFDELDKTIQPFTCHCPEIGGGRLALDDARAMWRAAADRAAQSSTTSEEFLTVALDVRRQREAVRRVGVSAALAGTAALVVTEGGPAHGDD